MSNAQAGPSRLPASSSSPNPPSSATQSSRLFIGNLAPTVDEYTLLQVFSKFGKISKLDLMVHKTGVLKGKPRGYAFVEYVNKEDAQTAMTKLHDRPLRGRKLVVTSAQSAPVSDLPYPYAKGRRTTEAPKTTTLSLLKSKKGPQSTSAQIAAMEAKLAAMARRKPADEDYVPGKSPYQPLLTPSGSASPAPPDPLYYDPALDESLQAEKSANGDIDVKKEVEDLERDILAEVERDKSGQENMLEEKKPTNGQATPEPARETAFKRGLASLPKRPDF